MPSDAARTFASSVLPTPASPSSSSGRPSSRARKTAVGEGAVGDVVAAAEVVLDRLDRAGPGGACCAVGHRRNSTRLGRHAGRPSRAVSDAGQPRARGGGHTVGYADCHRSVGGGVHWPRHASEGGSVGAPHRGCPAPRGVRGSAFGARPAATWRSSRSATGRRSRRGSSCPTTTGARTSGRRSTSPTSRARTSRATIRRSRPSARTAPAGSSSSRSRRRASSCSTGSTATSTPGSPSRSPKGHPLHDSWIDVESSQGEGAAFMQNGHLLIAKEKDPAAFIEFGPAGDEPSGFGPDSALAEGAGWPIKGGDHVFVPLAVWMPSVKLQANCEDFSDLEVGPDRRLYLLSDKSQIDRPRRRARRRRRGRPRRGGLEAADARRQAGGAGPDAQRPGDRRARHQGGEGEPRAARTTDRGGPRVVTATDRHDRARARRNVHGPARPAASARGDARRRGHQLRAVHAARDDGRAAHLRARTIRRTRPRRSGSTRTSTGPSTSGTSTSSG